MVEGIATQTVSASNVCTSINCSHSVLLTLPTSLSQIKGSVAAENVFGQGSSCTLQELQAGICCLFYYTLCLTIIMYISDSRNQIFTLKIFSTSTNNRTVECSQVMPMRQETFECEFCYSANISCQNLQSGYCITINNSAAALPLLNEVTYCYRATARINGNATAVIQGNFSTGKINCLIM